MRAPSWASRPSPLCPFKATKRATERTATLPAARSAAPAAASGPPLPHRPSGAGLHAHRKRRGLVRRATRVIGQCGPDARSRYKRPEAAACATVFAWSCRGFLLQQCLDGTRRSFPRPAGSSDLAFRHLLPAPSDRPQVPATATAPPPPLLSRPP